MAHLEYEHVFRRDPPGPKKPASAPPKSLLRRIATPTWKTRHINLPLLSDPTQVSREWDLDFMGRAQRPMESFAFESIGATTLRYIAVVLPKGVRPDAWLIYFRHTAKGADFNGDLLELGAGDYIDGRMQVSKQISISQKNVGAILPIAIGSCGEFAENQSFVTGCIGEIEKSIFGSALETKLLAASNSDGLFQLKKLLNNCKGLVKRIKGIYDFDGTHILAGGTDPIEAPGVRIFRYEGRLATGRDAVSTKEPERDFLTRKVSANPAMVPLALSRWRSHARFGEVRPGETPFTPHPVGDPKNEAQSRMDTDWLHHYIPTCMLHHGLVSTPGL